MDSTQAQVFSTSSIYSEPPVDGKHIRLIRVTKAEDDQTVRCEFSSWPIGSTPPYNAISYTWGDQENTAMIMLNGVETTVRANCAYVLRQSHWHDHNGYVWIDALCINQDDIAEKNVQVAMMGDIYKHAERVLACVGAHADDSEYLLRVIQDEAELYTIIPKIVDLDEWVPLRDELPPKLHREICNWLLQMVPLGFTRRARAYAAFFQRPYFHRVWVLQELYMAREIVVCCGNDQLPFGLLPGYQLAMALVDKIRRKSLARVLKDCEGIDVCRTFLVQLLSRGIGRRRSHPPLQLSTMIDIGRRERDLRLTTARDMPFFVELKCQDPRDMVYATLSILDWPKLIPDYSISCFDLALSILEKSAPRDHDYMVVLSGWLVNNLQLHEQIIDIETRIYHLSIPGSGPPNPTSKQTQTHHIMAGYGYKLLKRNSQPGLYIEYNSRKSNTKRFLGPAMETGGMRAGDIAIRIHNVTPRWYSCMVVARAQEDGHFALIGYTAFEESLEPIRWTRTRLEIHLDAEDMLMLQILFLRELWPDTDEEFKEKKGLSKLLSRRVCRFEGSSFVVGVEEFR